MYTLRSSLCRYLLPIVLFIISISAATTSLAMEPRVDGLNELVVIRPGTHERGLPAVNLDPTDGGLVVDIPPTVHVHRYYYSGDKEFQGPLLQGGPTVVVASHPVSGERMYIEATLPSGAPIIAHNKARITYIYPDRCVSIHFHRRDNCQAAVKYHGSRGIWRQTVECSHETGEKLKECMVNSPTVQSCKDASCAAGTALLGVKQAIDTSVACLIDRVKTLPAMVPGVTALASMGQDREQRNYENQIRSATRQKNLAEPTFLPTNR